jgi:hypothetical protein
VFASRSESGKGSVFTGEQARGGRWRRIIMSSLDRSAVNAILRQDLYAFVCSYGINFADVQRAISWSCSSYRFRETARWPYVRPRGFPRPRSCADRRAEGRPFFRQARWRVAMNLIGAERWFPAAAPRSLFCQGRVLIWPRSSIALVAMGGICPDPRHLEEYLAFPIGLRRARPIDALIRAILFC